MPIPIPQRITIHPGLSAPSKKSSIFLVKAIKYSLLSVKLLLLWQLLLASVNCLKDFFSRHIASSACAIRSMLTAIINVIKILTTVLMPNTPPRQG